MTSLNASVSDSPIVGTPRFVTTHWDLVRDASDHSADERHEALQKLLVSYRPALCDYLSRQFRFSQSEAEDLIQGFILNRILKKSLIGKAHPARGKFRTFLIAALNSYVVDQLRHENAKSRFPEQGFVSLSDLLEEDIGQSAPQGEEVFQESLARQLIAEALQKTRNYCTEAGIPEAWTILNERLLRPIFEQVPATPFEVLKDRLGLETAREARNKLGTAKRAFRRLFEQRAAELCEDDASGSFSEKIQQLFEDLGSEGSFPT